ncbi:ApeP family dehydratase [Marinobacterium lutimaris]|uniref:Predicted 3-hydroxylacyl-ACP dehydratase, HotDog domain n=1 Tax=Marinobacterium lutimaris TaxID=568106 RepID=A0A1H5TCJ0_9GAMM|nr:hypothetical protein [Marinobacterium lutimaris]SEF60483.1 Predicted 3-hydroxylacyl-ACP dehydratase, HotDog domain [Marinobacterium lutimaris]
MKQKFSIDEIVPQSGTMSLLSDLVDHGDGWIETSVAIESCSLFCTEKGVPAWVGIEYMAQTIGAHAGLQERLSGREPAIGFLVGTRRYSAETSLFSVGQQLSVYAEHSFTADNGLMVFDCRIAEAGRLLAEASLNVYQPDDVTAYVSGE